MELEYESTFIGKDNNYSIAYNKLMQRLDMNLAYYRKQMMTFSVEEVMDMAERIAATHDMHFYLTDGYYHDFDQDDLEFLLRFENPLELLTDALNERLNEIIDERDYAINNVLANKEAMLDEYSLIVALPDQASMTTAESFGKAIEDIMPLVQSGDDSISFIINRQSSELWSIAYVGIPDNAGEMFNFIKQTDPPALMFTGKDFSKGSYSMVYDDVVRALLQAEYELKPTDEARAMNSFLCDNIAMFSPDTVNHFVTVKYPLAELTKLSPYKLSERDDGFGYDETYASALRTFIQNYIGGSTESRITHNADITDSTNNRAIPKPETELNRDCALAMDAAINSVYTPGEMSGTGYYDLTTAYNSVTELFGAERVKLVTAAIIQSCDYDGRYSQKNKQWSKGMDIPSDSRLYVNAHPAVFDGFCDRVRAADVPMKTQERKMNSPKKKKSRGGMER